MVGEMPAEAPACPAECLDLGAALEARVGHLWWLLLRTTGGDLSRTAAAVLAALREEGPMRVTDLATREAVAQPTMTVLVNRLEREGYVERTPDPADGRATLVAVTPVGLERLDQRARRRAECLGRRLEALDPDQRRALAEALPALDDLINPAPKEVTA
jgi:DNA-binding MarR family transcriptional regulator